jgi:hypothetical protein
MVACLVGPRWWHERRQALEKLQRLEHDVRRAIAPSFLELVEQAAIREL